MDNTKDAAPPHRAPTLELIKRLFRRYIAIHKWDLIKAMALMVISAAMTALIALLVQPVLDDVLTQGGKDTIIPVALSVLGAFFLRGASTYGHTIIMSKISHGVVGNVQHDLFNHFLTLDLSFFHKNPSGHLISRVINDVDVMRMAISDTLVGIGKSAVTMTFLIGVMIYRDWQLSLAAFAILPFAALFVGFIGRKLRSISYNTQERQGSLSDYLSQVFHAIRQVKAYGMEGFERERAGKMIRKVRKLNVKSARVGNMSTPVNEALIGLVLMGVIIYGGYKAAAGIMTAGQLASFLSAFIMAYEPMKKLSRLNNTLQTGLGATERIFGILDQNADIEDRENAKPLKTGRPKISFKNVDFIYENAETHALQEISFVAEPGKMTALVGPSGGGKSTIINLIPRFYDVSGGAITIDGTDIRDLKIASLRAHIALVSQDISIFDDTAAANIAYGRPDAGEEEIIKASKAAAAHEFIEAMPDGYQTILGENGVKLSGGQRQRISIARAILRDAPILLLDEATSALDNESEKIVQDALAKLQKGRTTLVIAHRLSTVQEADQILVLDAGRIVERGRHEELVAQGGLYAKMYASGLKT